jgi:vacuolar-type H+-ATPase subunit H
LVRILYVEMHKTFIIFQLDYLITTEIQIHYLQHEQKQMVEEARSKMKDLQERYRNEASSPANDDLAEMAKIRTRIRALLIEKSNTNSHVYRERNVQSRLSSTRSNQWAIYFRRPC